MLIHFVSPCLYHLFCHSNKSWIQLSLLNLPALSSRTWSGIQENHLISQTLCGH